MTYETMRHEVDGPVLTLTLDRPQAMNAYTAQMGAELARAVNAASEDDSIRAIILTASGRVFCAGADLSAGAGRFDTSAGGAGATNFGGRRPEDRAGGASFIHALFNSKKPVITAYNGAAVGVGATMALPTDVRIAVDTARFGFVFARRGLVPEAGSAWFLPQIVGLPQALRWCLSGRLFDAQEALKGGLISEAVSAEDLLPRAREIAMEMAQNTAPVALAITRQMLWRFAGAELPFDLLKVDGPFVQTMGAMDDCKEGVGAFLEKRAPNFPGKISEGMPAGYPWWTPDD